MELLEKRTIPGSVGELLSASREVLSDYSHHCILCDVTGGSSHQLGTSYTRPPHFFLLISIIRLRLANCTVSCDSLADLKSPGMCNGSAFYIRTIIRYCGLNLNIIATDKRPECLFDKLFCSVRLKAPRQHKHKRRHFPEFSCSSVVLDLHSHPVG